MSATVTINAEGGFGNYQYSIDGSTYQTSNQFSEVPGGNYYGYVKDDNNCVASGSFTVIGPESGPSNYVLHETSDSKDYLTTENNDRVLHEGN